MLGTVALGEAHGAVSATAGMGWAQSSMGPIRPAVAEKSGHLDVTGFLKEETACPEAFGHAAVALTPH